MKVETLRTIAWSMYTIALFTLCLVAFLHTGAISNLENGQAYTFEVIRQRPVMPDFCKALSGDKMACTTNAQRLCRCTFYKDQQDTEYQMLIEEIARRLDVETAEQARAVAEAAAGAGRSEE